LFSTISEVNNMQILLAQINPTVGNLYANTQLILDAIAAGKRLGAQIVLFPELAITGYPPEDFLLLPHFMAEAEQQLARIVAASVGIAAVVGIPRYSTGSAEKNLCNSAAIIEDGCLLGFQDKSLLPTYDVFDERRYFEAAATQSLWPLAGRQVAVTICEDIWQHSATLRYTTYKRDPIEELATLHPDFALNLSASPYSLSKPSHRYEVCAKAARTLNCPLLLCNQVGGNDSLIFDGHSLCVDAAGQLIAQAEGFQEALLLVDLEAPAQESIPPVDPLAELHSALLLGLKDYFHKLGFKRACLGLSGGIDSAVVAYLAAEALGADQLMGISMPSRFSSPGSRQDAEALALKLGIAYREVPIEGPFSSFLELLEPHFDGRPWDVTEENLQARIRGTILMSFSNKMGSLLLSTGNKSELAVGYSTLYGDMCGGLSVIGDLTKTQVYALAHWINRHGEIIPWNTIYKAPSAELRPNQKDSDSLPDYAILDTILQAYVEMHMAPSNIASSYGYPQPLVDDIIHRIHLNEYKRRQGAPSLRVSEQAFSIGRRFPIVQQFT
jgi:NAD+ synthase (glutamine-hydrolysing)